MRSRIKSGMTRGRIGMLIRTKMREHLMIMRFNFVIGGLKRHHSILPGRQFLLAGGCRVPEFSIHRYKNTVRWIFEDA